MSAAELSTESIDADPLSQVLLEEWQRSVPEAVTIAAKDIANQYGGHALGIIFYGSCLRTGDYEDKILDFYVIVDSYRDAYGSFYLATANKILPPNVFYHEIDVDGTVVRSKYAVLSKDALAFRVSENCLNVSVWARFCQPCLVMHAKSDAIKAEIAGYIAAAVRTMIANVVPLMDAGEAVEYSDYWIRAFSETYRAELRSEGRSKGREIYMLDKDRYDQISPLVIDKDVLAAGRSTKAQRSLAKLKWFRRRINGKIVSFLRLIKATTTFDGGIDYLAWKIGRHSGVQIEIKPWMRRHPVIAGLSLFIKLRLAGAFR